MNSDRDIEKTVIIEVDKIRSKVQNYLIQRARSKSNTSNQTFNRFLPIFFRIFYFNIKSNINLEQLVNTYKELQNLSRKTGYKVPPMILVLLGSTFVTTGDRLSVSRISMSIESYHYAIKVYSRLVSKGSRKTKQLQYSNIKRIIGDSWSKLFRLTHLEIDLRNCITFYEASLKIEKSFMKEYEYAVTNSNCGKAFIELAEITNPISNCEKALKYINEALKYYSPDKYSREYYNAIFDLGMIYETLARFKDRKDNCKLAIKKCNEAARFFLRSNSLEDYASCKTVVGVSYGLLSEKPCVVKNSNKAIQAFCEALKIVTKRKDPVNNAINNMDLGSAYRTLARYKKSNDIAKKAISCYRNAQKIFNTNTHSTRFLQPIQGLSLVHLDMASYTAKKSKQLKLYSKVILEINESLGYLTLPYSRIDFARVSENLGDAYRKRGYITNSIDDIEQAIKAYKNTLSIYTIKDNPEKYGYMKWGIALCYLQLSVLHRKGSNYRSCNSAVSSALKVFTSDSFPDEHNEMNEILKLLDKLPKTRRTTLKKPS